MGKAKISRRRFIKVAGASAVAGSTLSILSACQPNTTAQSGGGGNDGGGGNKKLNFYNWSDYVAESTIPNFEKKTGAKVTQDTFASNEELLAKLQGRRNRLRRYRAVRLHGRHHGEERCDPGARLLQDPELRQHWQELQRVALRPGEQVQRTLPVGTTGILYNKKKVGPVENWDRCSTSNTPGK